MTIFHRRSTPTSAAPKPTDEGTGAVPIMAIPAGLTAIGAASAAFRDAISVKDLPAAGLRRVTFDDLDVLIASTNHGLAAVDDRCPHMAAPLSLGSIEGCVVSCPLHNGRFDLLSGNVDRMPTTGGLLPDGTYVPTWTLPGKDPKPDPPGIKADARRLTRVRRMRYYPVRVRGGRIEVAIPEG